MTTSKRTSKAVNGESGEGSRVPATKKSKISKKEAQAAANLSSSTTVGIEVSPSQSIEIKKESEALPHQKAHFTSLAQVYGANVEKG